MHVWVFVWMAKEGRGEAIEAHTYTPADKTMQSGQALLLLVDAAPTPERLHTLTCLQTVDTDKPPDPRPTTDP